MKKAAVEVVSPDARAVRCRVVLAAVLMLGISAGCAPSRSDPLADLEARRPRQRCRAIVRVVEQEPPGAVPLLVDRLEDEDAAVRFLAIVGLEKLTGRRMGFEYHAPAARRRAAVERWRRFLAQSADASSEGSADGTEGQ